MSSLDKITSEIYLTQNKQHLMKLESVKVTDCSHEERRYKKVEAAKIWFYRRFKRVKRT